MQQLPLLRGTEINLVNPIQSYLKKRYGKKSITDAVNTINTIQKQRMVCIGIQRYRSINDINEYKCYFDYLRQLETVVPLSGNRSVDISFQWYSAFNNKKMVCSDVIFEKSCVLYNIAAMYTQAAYEMYSVEDQTEERFRACISYLRASAAYFDELCHMYSAKLQTLKIGYDFDPTVLRIYKAISMAQGQHMYYAMARAMKLANQALMVLLKVCSDYYKELYDLCSSVSYLPKDLGKHFLLQHHYTKISTIHFYGLYLMNREKENSGTLYALAKELDKAVAEAQTLMKSFYLEAADREQGETIFNMVRDDKQQFYRIYRIYYGIVPEQVAIPEGRSKMEKADSLELTEIPLNFNLPENTDINEALAKYEERRSTIISDCRTIYNEHKGKTDAIMRECLLPELLTGEGFQAGLPPTLSQHVTSVHERGSIQKLQQEVDLIQNRCLTDETLYKEIEKVVENGSPFKETANWIKSTLNRAKKDYEEISKNVTEMANQPTIFRKSVAELSVSLPMCDEYPTDAAPMGVRNATDQVMTYRTTAQQLMQALESDRSGEPMVRNRVQADGNLLNIETTIFEATQSLTNTVKRIQENLSTQKSLMASMVSEYKAWMKTRKVTPKMKERDDSLKNVSKMLTLFDNTESSCKVTREMLDLVDLKIDELRQALKM